MSRSEYHVGDTVCPECGRRWTGEFKDVVPDEAICRDDLLRHEAEGVDRREVRSGPWAVPERPPLRLARGYTRPREVSQASGLPL